MSEKNEHFEASDFFHMEEKERLQSLEDNCEKVTSGFVYFKPLSEFEIKEKNTKLNQSINEAERLKEDRKALGVKITELQKGVLSTNADLIRGYMETCETIYEVANLETGFIERINSEGYIIEKTRFKEGSTLSLFNAQRQQNKAM